MSEEWNTRHSLLLRAKDPDDEQAWEEFVKHYERFIYHLLHRMNINADDFNDLVQDILIKLWKNLKSYEVQEAKFRTWLTRVVRNTVYDYFSKEKRRSDAMGKVEEVAAHLHDTSPSQLDEIIEQEWVTYLSDMAIERMRKVFSGDAVNVFLMSLDGATTQEISKKLNLTTDSVYTLRNRVKARYLKEVRAIMDYLEA